MNILERANNIINNRSEEKEREYGPISESITKAAVIATSIGSKILTTVDVFNAMIGLKLARESYAHKEDNLLDAVAYTGALNNYYNEKGQRPVPNSKLEMYKDIKNIGELVTVRGLATREILNYKLVLKPYDCFFFFEGRADNMKYIKTELQWYFRGDQSDLSICDHASIWKNHVKDNRINSNYGHYIFKMRAIEYVVECLLNDQYSRRAVITILGSEHLCKDSVDVPCTSTISFMIRNNKLLTTVHMRSNDAILGICNDIPFFSIISQLVLARLVVTYHNLKLGDYTHLVDSLHVYDKHFKTLDNIIEKSNETIITMPRVSYYDYNSILENGHADIDGEFDKWLKS